MCGDSSAITCRSSPDERPGGLPRPAGQGAVPLVAVPAPSLLLVVVVVVVMVVVAPAGGGLGGAALQGGVGHLHLAAPLLQQVHRVLQTRF